MENLFEKLFTNMKNDMSQMRQIRLFDKKFAVVCRDIDRHHHFAGEKKSFALNSAELGIASRRNIKRQERYQRMEPN